ncbi:MAG: FkbM family methyltransferase, partial [Solirubrobacteraceae bacterium]
IGPQAGNLPFFRIAVSDAFWATGLSSFSRSTLERGLRRHMAKQGYEPPHKEGDFIEEVTVPTVTVDQLLRRYDVRALDVVCVDTEGFDFEILKLIDYERLHPEVVVFESRHLSAAEYGGALALLRSRGYWIGQHKFDTVASTVKYPARVRLMTRALGRVRKLTRKGRRRARRLVGRAVERMPAGWRRAGK